MEAMRKLHNDDLGKLLLRLTVGGLMLFHGIGKLRGGVDFIGGQLDQHGLPKMIAYGVYLGEVAAPILILLGVLTRPAALIVAINMIVAVALVHSQQLFTLNKMGIWELELQAFYFLSAMAVFFLGAGRYSISRGSGAWD